MTGVAITIAAAALVASSPSPAVRSKASIGEGVTAARAGGVNAMPSMRPWRYLGANPDSWWCTANRCNGVADGMAFVDRELPLMAALGARVVRVEFPWALIEPNRNRFDWRRSDAIVRAAARARIALQPILVYSPGWAAGAPNAPPVAAGFSRFAQAFVHRYRGRVHYYELWNEPDLDRYWGGSEAQYVRRILIPGYRAIKREDRRARVILGGPSRADRSWLEGIYRYGGGRSFDIGAFHDYASAQAVLADAQIVASILAAHGQRRKPIWLGEYGYPDSDPASPNQIPLIQQVLTGAAPIAMAEWYSFRDTYTATCCPPRVIGFSPWGLMTARYERKAAYAAMQSMLRGAPMLLDR